ncbi:MAG TPA: hypothetical protein VMS08_02785, partial [Candidatus Saccharimonadia bacterium]|nr:hypothetical protein [Candidatus Saccharimonadia bacterium]
TLASTTPVTSFQDVAASTTQTSSVAVANSGSVLLFAWVGTVGVSGQTVTASDATLTTDGPFNPYTWGHGNNVAASAASHVTIGWSGSAEGALGLIVYR